MKPILRSLLPLLCAVPLLSSAQAAEFDTHVVMTNGGAATFYVPGQIPGAGPMDFMVDTGAGYTAINEETLGALLEVGRAHYVKDLVGVLANGSRMIVKVYRVKAINVGGNCWLHDVDAAVFPGKTRQILGLSALSKAAPFIFSVDPPKLSLSNCGVAPQDSAQPGPQVRSSDADGTEGRTQIAASDADPLTMRVADQGAGAASVPSSKALSSD